MSLFPTQEFDAGTAAQYNRIVAEEFESIRDFLVLHYHSTRGRSGELWNTCSHMPLPESLVYKEEQFARTGRIILSTDELFKESSWFAVLLGQGHTARDYNPLIDSISSSENTEHLRRVREGIQAICAKMRPHVSFL